MSADNWTLCPVCHTNHEADVELYTLREDYYQGMDKHGVWSQSYTCYCKRCKFTWTHKCEVKVDFKRKPFIPVARTPADWTDGTA